MSQHQQCLQQRPPTTHNVHAAMQTLTDSTQGKINLLLIISSLTSLQLYCSSLIFGYITFHFKLRVIKIEEKNIKISQNTLRGIYLCQSVIPFWKPLMIP